MCVMVEKYETFSVLIYQHEQKLYQHEWKLEKTRNCVETRNYLKISPDPNVVSNKIIVSNKLLGCYG